MSAERRRRAGRSVISVLIAIAVLLTAAFAVWRLLIAPQVELYMYPLGYTELVERYSKENGLPSELVYAVILTESSFHEDALSSAGAKGLMQLTDDTSEWVAMLLGEEPRPDDIYEPELNIRRGCRLLAYLYAEFGGWEEALAAYNAGIGRVRGWLENPELSEGGRLICESIPIAETRAYVERVLKAADKYRSLYFS